MRFFIDPADVEAIAEVKAMCADVATIPPKVIKQLVQYPLTDKGLAAILADWNELQGR